MLTAPERLGSLRAPSADEATTLLLSAASRWEIAIKYAVGRLVLPEPPSTYVPSRVRTTAFTPIAVERTHALSAGTLPRHHDDPFDRLLVAQARSYDVPLATVDDALTAYDVAIRRP